MSVRLERWSHDAAPSFGQPSLDAPKLHAWSLIARLRAFRLQRTVSERHGGMFVAAMLIMVGELDIFGFATFVS